jgi:hypothetical protein
MENNSLTGVGYPRKAGEGEGREEKRFFFEKKKQKTFPRGART